MGFLFDAPHRFLQLMLCMKSFRFFSYTLSRRLVTLVFIVIASVIRVPAQTATSQKPNIIFILADDLGYGDLGCYGQSKIKTPNIDRLAAEGIRFTQCYAGSTVCAP